jgi:ABC-type sugar transport system permease subunit
MSTPSSLIAQDRKLGWLLLLPSLIVMLAVILWPLIYSFFLSFQNLNISNPDRGREFVGWDNYVRVISSKPWWKSWLRTIYFVLADLLIGIPLGLGIAVLLNRDFKLKGVIFAIILFPYVLAPIVNSLIWKLIYDPNYGFLNGILLQLGLIKEYIPWLSKPSLAIVMLIIANLWQGTPFAIILFLAGLKAIPKEEYEAASVDGASGFTSFWYITLPHLKPILYMNFVMKTILTFKLFDIVYSLTGGGPGGSTEVVGMMIYRESFEFMRFGVASAMSYLLLFLVVVLVIFYSWAFKEEKE